MDGHGRAVGNGYNWKGRFQRATMTQSMTELLSLIPILLASPTAPLLPPFRIATRSSPLLPVSVTLRSSRFTDSCSNTPQRRHHTSPC